MICYIIIVSNKGKVRQNMNMRHVIAIIISIISISLLAHTNVSASYMPTNPIDKDVDGQPAGEEYKDKFEFVLKDPEGNLVGPTIKNDIPANLSIKKENVLKINEY